MSTSRTDKPPVEVRMLVMQDLLDEGRQPHVIETLGDAAYEIAMQAPKLSLDGYLAVKSHEGY